MIGLNAGSGQRCFDTKEGWVNMDLTPRKHGGAGPNVLGDMFRMPVLSTTMDYVVSSHTLEHLRCGQADEFIKEAYRVLKPGGSFIVSIPDIRALAQRWLTKQITDYIFIINMMGAYIDCEADYHKWHYTRDGLAKLLTSNGNWTIKNFDNRKIKGMDLSADWWIMSIEAVKNAL